MTLNCNRTLYTDGPGEISRSDCINIPIYFFLVKFHSYYAASPGPTCAANKILLRQHCSSVFGGAREKGDRPFCKGNNRPA